MPFIHESIYNTKNVNQSGQIGPSTIIIGINHDLYDYSNEIYKNKLLWNRCGLFVLNEHRRKNVSKNPLCLTLCNIWSTNNEWEEHSVDVNVNVFQYIHVQKDSHNNAI